MIEILRNKSRHKNYTTYPVFSQKSHNYVLIANKFVVPWQMEEVKKEKKDTK